MAYSSLLSLRHLLHVSLIISVLYSAVCVTGNNNNNDSSSSSSSTTSEVAVSMSNHPAVNININSNGDLAYESLLSSPYITNALIRNNDHATCFFWRLSHDSKFASHPFTQSQPLLLSFGTAERLYCFDNAADSTAASFADVVDDDDDGMHSFVLFLEYADGQQKLVRLSIENDNDNNNDNVDYNKIQNAYAEAQIGPGTEIGNPIAAALVGVPPADYLMSSGPAHSHCICYFVPRGQRLTQGAFLKSVTTRTNARLNESEAYESVVCFKDFFDREARSQWFRAGSRQ